MPVISPLTFVTKTEVQDFLRLPAQPLPSMMIIKYPTEMVYLRRRNRGLLQGDVVHQSSSWLNEAFSILKTNSVVSKCHVRWKDCLHFFTNSHIGNYFVKTWDNCRFAKFPQETILFSFCMGCIKDLAKSIKI